MEYLQSTLDEFLDSLPKEKQEKLEENLPEIINEDLVPSLADDYWQTLKNNAQEMLNEKREEETEFTKRNCSKWKAPFDLLESSIVICIEAGDYFNENNRPKAVQEEDLVFDSVVRLHARACHIASEIMTLAKNGFPDGAQARWRALHEVVCISYFIKKHGQEAAQRYFDHEVVQSFKGMRQYQKFVDKLNTKPFSYEEYENAEGKYDEIIEKYGKNFKKNYGWASKFVDNKKNTNFTDIEKDVNLDHMRPYYKFASQNIHGNAKGLLNKLGLGKTNPRILLVGQSDAGMGIPVHSTAISLFQITTTALTISPNLDRVIILKTIQKAVDEIGDTLKEMNKS